MNVSDAMFDPKLSYTGFTMQRTTYRRQNGTSVPMWTSTIGSKQEKPPRQIRRGGIRCQMVLRLSDVGRVQIYDLNEE